MNLNQARIICHPSAGDLLRCELHAPKRAQSVLQHDIKLELDVRCQQIARALKRAFPEVALLGEEGVASRTPPAAGWWIRLMARSISPMAFRMRACPSCCSSAPRAGLITATAMIRWWAWSILFCRELGPPSAHSRRA